MTYVLWHVAPGRKAVVDAQLFFREGAIWKMRWLNALAFNTNCSNRYYIEKVH